MTKATFIQFSMQSVIIRFCSVLLIAVLPMISFADIIDDLYSTRVPVSDQTSSSQNAAFRASMNQVLIKVSGNRDITDNALVKSTLSQARNFLVSYRFDIDQAIYLIAEFDEEKINQLVRDAGFPIWGKRRPSILLWLAEQEGDNRHIINTQTEFETKSLLDDFARNRGIRFNYPLMDLEDLSVINVFDVWGRFDDVVRVASERYLPEMLLSARVYQTNSGDATGDADVKTANWQLDWQILNYDIAEQGLFIGDNKADVLQQFSDMTSNYLAAKYAVDMSTFQSDEGNVLLYIMNLDSIESYAEIIKFFESLTMVEEATLTRLNGSTGEFSLSIAGFSDDLIATLALDGKIFRKTDAFGQVGEQLEYFWSP